MNTNRASLTEVAQHFDISKLSTIWSWQRKFEEKGVEALFKRRGRAKSKHSKKKIRLTVNVDLPKFNHHFDNILHINFTVSYNSISFDSLSQRKPINKSVVFGFKDSFIVLTN